MNAVEALSKSTVPFTPNTLVVGGSDSGGGVLEGLGALLMHKLAPGTVANVPASATEHSSGQPSAGMTK